MAEGGAEIRRVHAEQCCSPLKVHFKSNPSSINYGGEQEGDKGLKSALEWEEAPVPQFKSQIKN